MTSRHRRLNPDVFVAARKALNDHRRVPQDVLSMLDQRTATLTGTVPWLHDKVRSRRHRRVTSMLCNESSRTSSWRLSRIAEGFEAPESS